MDYRRHYEKLIERARNRTLSGYAETHHVVPRCIGGSDERGNLVEVTPEEHYVAHQLLHKMYPQEPKLFFALIVMLGNPHKQRTNKLYGWVRRKNAQIVSVKSLEMWRDPEYRAKHKAAMDIVRASPEYRAKFSKIHKGRIKSPEECANISKGKTGLKYRPISEDSRANMAAARRKTWDERRANGTDKLIGQKTRETRIKNGSYKFSDEHRAAISVAQRGRPIPPEQRAKISESMKRYRSSIKPPKAA